MTRSTARPSDPPVLPGPKGPGLRQMQAQMRGQRTLEPAMEPVKPLNVTLFRLRGRVGVISRVPVCCARLLLTSHRGGCTFEPATS